MDILDEIKKDLSPAIKKSVEAFLSDLGEDAEKMKDVMAQTMIRIAGDLKRGKNIAAAIEDMDAEATLLLSAVYSKMGEKQAKVAKATRDLLGQIGWVILKRVIAATVVIA